MKLKVLHLIPDLNYHSASGQLELLSTTLPRERFTQHVVTLGVTGPVERRLMSAGVSVESLGWTRAFDLLPLWRWRQQCAAFQPDLMHVWQPAGLRWAGLLGRAGCPVVVSKPLSRTPKKWTAKLDGWLLQRANRVTVAGSAEAQRCRSLGLTEEKLICIPPGAASVNGCFSSRSTQLELPANARCVACIGPLEAPKGLDDAIWAYDILRQLEDDLHLLLIGNGSEKRRLSEFVRRIGAVDQVHFLGDREDVAAVLSLAEVVWIPGRAGGSSAALEAMRAGRPVVASRLAELAEVIIDGETGFLIAPGDKAALCRRTRLLLNDAALRHRLGQQGLERADRDFSASNMVNNYVQLYEQLAA
jgi:glycosyltransferase involved in cell wall biosynthesis